MTAGSQLDVAGGSSQLAKYEAWIRALEIRRENSLKVRGKYVRVLTALLIASNIGFYWGVWIGVGCLGSGLLIFGYGVLTVFGLEWDCINEIESMRRGADLLRDVEAGRAPNDTNKAPR